MNQLTTMNMHADRMLDTALHVCGEHAGKIAIGSFLGAGVVYYVSQALPDSVSGRINSVVGRLAEAVCAVSISVFVARYSVEAGGGLAALCAVYFSREVLTQLGNLNLPNVAISAAAVFATGKLAYRAFSS